MRAIEDLREFLAHEKRWWIGGLVAYALALAAVAWWLERGGGSFVYPIF